LFNAKSEIFQLYQVTFNEMMIISALY